MIYILITSIFKSLLLRSNIINNRERIKKIILLIYISFEIWLLINNYRDDIVNVLDMDKLSIFIEKDESYTVSTFLSLSLISKELNAWWVTGFTDAEGYFGVKINKNKKGPFPYKVQLHFAIGLHSKDLHLLNLIKSFFNTGKVHKNSETMYSLNVYSLEDIITIIIPHFEKYPLLTKKHKDFILFKQVALLMQQKLHLTDAGLLLIINLRASLNKGLNPALKKAFPLHQPVIINIADITHIPSFDWFAGFVSGDGHFGVRVNKAASRLQVSLNFSISQHMRDTVLFTFFKTYYNCGTVILDREAVYFNVNRFSDIYNIIIPLFKKHPILGIKALDFEDFSKIADLMKEKKHLTKEGLDLILKIRSNMNSYRT